MKDSNVRVSSNVMVDCAPIEQVRYLPGDLAVLVYAGGLWTSPTAIKDGLTKKQYQEYLQYLRCHLCNRSCAGTCRRR
jgi:hypothetical protein